LVDRRSGYSVIDPTLEKALWLGAAAMVGLNGKIVFDWLRAKRNGRSGATCPLHEQCQSEVSDLKRCTAHMKSELAVQDERTETILKRLDDGREDFRIMRGEISDIKVSLGELAGRAQ
jgi:hypothetical protein